jgi:hypothetical protein
MKRLAILLGVLALLGLVSVADASTILNASGLTAPMRQLHLMSWAQLAGTPR